MTLVDQPSVDQRNVDQRIVIVGGGPAGLATAIAARQAGLAAELYDRALPPIDKACGEGLMPDGVDVLRRLGLRFDRLRTHPFHGIRYLDMTSGEVAEGRFPDVCGFGVRRLDLHQALVARAEEVGVSLHWDERVTWSPQGIQTEQGLREAAWIVAADGLRSKIRRQAGLEGRAASWQRFGVRRHYHLAPWSDCVDVYWADDCEAYITPVAADEVGVAILWSGRKAGFDELLQSFPALVDRLRGAETLSRDRGSGPLRQKVQSVQQGRLALVGDASGYLDAITGEGLSLAFHQALAVVEAMREGDLRAYERDHRRVGALPNALMHLMLWIERHPALRRRVIRALAREPQIFDRFLAVHCRARPWHSLLGARTAPRLLWSLVRR